MPTALALTPTQWQAYYPNQATASIRDTAREQRAWQTAQAIAIQLKQQFAAQRVVLFGSLAREGMFTHWSDIDLAVWGIPPHLFYRAVATSLSTEFKVDVVDPADCRPHLRHAIETEGVEL